MSRFRLLPAFVVLLGSGAGMASSTDDPRAGGPPPDLAARVLAITDAVLAHHLDPPSRDEMLAAGFLSLIDGRLVLGDRLATLRRAGGGAGAPRGPDLARRIQEVETAADLARLLEDAWPGGDPDRDPEGAFLEGIAARVPGPLNPMTDSERAAREQFAGNRYVGLQIAASYDEEAGLVEIREALDGGPADRAGLRPGDRIEAIDGEPMVGMPFRSVLERLRGNEGTSLTLVIRRPDVDEPMTMELRREAMPRPTVAIGNPGGVELPRSAAYVTILQLAGSTLHELRTLEADLRSEGKAALILDLRRVSAIDSHPAVLVADGLLGAGPTGAVRTVDGVREFRAGPDRLFRDWPTVVLIDGTTSGAAEWLAAALKDRGRAALVGMATAGEPFQNEAVPLAGGGWVELRTGELLRVGGRPIREVDAGDLAQRRRLVAAMPRPQAARFGEHPGLMGRGLKPDHAAGPLAPPDRGRPGDPALLRAAELLSPASDAEERSGDTP